MNTASPFRTQKYKDSNAFVVYYTQGFDGAGRPSIEARADAEVIERRTRQYGYRLIGTRQEGGGASTTHRRTRAGAFDEKAETPRTNKYSNLYALKRNRRASYCDGPGLICTGRPHGGVRGGVACCSD